MDPLHMLVWSQISPTQEERSRAAHTQHVRSEVVREARGARTPVVSVLARAWQSLAGATRTSAEAGSLATQP